MQLCNTVMLCQKRKNKFLPDPCSRQFLLGFDLHQILLFWQLLIEEEEKKKGKYGRYQVTEIDPHFCLQALKVH